MHCITAELRCTALYCTTLYCTAIVWHFTNLYYIALDLKVPSYVFQKLKGKMNTVKFSHFKLYTSTPRKCRSTSDYVKSSSKVCKQQQISEILCLTHCFENEYPTLLQDLHSRESEEC